MKTNFTKSLLTCLLFFLSIGIHAQNYEKFKQSGLIGYLGINSYQFLMSSTSIICCEPIPNKTSDEYRKYVNKVQFYNETKILLDVLISQLQADLIKRGAIGIYKNLDLYYKNKKSNLKGLALSTKNRIDIVFPPVNTVVPHDRDSSAITVTDIPFVDIASFGLDLYNSIAEANMNKVDKINEMLEKCRLPNLKDIECRECK